MLSLFKKLRDTYKVIKDNKETLKKELNDLTGVTKEVIEKILEIWK